MTIKYAKANNVPGPPNADGSKPPKLPKQGSAAAPASPHIKLVDIKKAAAFLNVSVSTVRRLRKGGAIAACPVGGRVMFNFFDLVAYVRQGQMTDLV